MIAKNLSMDGEGKDLKKIWVLWKSKGILRSPIFLHIFPILKSSVYSRLPGCIDNIDSLYSCILSALKKLIRLLMLIEVSFAAYVRHLRLHAMQTCENEKREAHYIKWRFPFGKREGNVRGLEFSGFSVRIWYCAFHVLRWCLSDPSSFCISFSSRGDYECNEAQVT